MAKSFHLFPYRTQKLSSFTSKILGWRRPGKIDRCRHLYAPLAQLVEQLTLNQWVLGSSPRWCTKRLVGQAVKTPPFHGGITSSNLVRVTTSEWTLLHSDFSLQKISHALRHSSFSQKGTLGSPVRLQAPSRRLSVAITFL